MHEISIAQGIIEIIKKHLPPDRPHRVRSVRLKVGDLAGVASDSLEICFEAATIGTPLQGAKLKIERVPGISHCLECDREFELGCYPSGCPYCENAGIEMVSGNELDVVEVELVD